MKRAGAFIDSLASEKKGRKRAREPVPEVTVATSEEDPLFLLCDEAFDDVLDFDVPSTPVIKEPPAKKQKVRRAPDATVVETLPGETLEAAGVRHATALKQLVEDANDQCVGRVFPQVLDADSDATYRKKKLAAFSVTITLPVKVAQQFCGTSIYASKAVMAAFKQVCDIFQAPLLEGRSVSDSKKQFRAFLKKADGNPMYRRVEMKGKHEFDCIRKTKFFPAMEVQPGAQTLLHVQAHLEVYYFYDGHFFHANPQEITRIFESLGYEWARVHIEHKNTEVYDSKQYTRIPASKKKDDYWKKKSDWKKDGPVKLPAGSFSKTVYVDDE